jgi:hypothetical protein
MDLMIGITGHTKGLGKHLYEKLVQKDAVKGFSRTNGYDIKSPVDRKKIIREVQECDVFINLVHNYYHQSDLMFELFKSWEKQDKLIINISSKVVVIDEWGLDRFDYLEYKTQKQNLERLSSNLTKRNALPKILNYRISEINFDVDGNNLNSMIDEFRLHKK